MWRWVTNRLPGLARPFKLLKKACFLSNLKSLKSMPYKTLVNSMSAVLQSEFDFNTLLEPMKCLIFLKFVWGGGS